jgi:transglutaminase-like putative cysteine protease
MQAVPMDVQIDVQHLTEYRYGAAVSLAHHQAYLRPLEDAHQRLVSHALAIEPAADWQRQGQDSRGNGCLWFTLAQGHSELRVRSRSTVALRPRFARVLPEAAPAWDTLAQRLRYVARAPFEPAVEYTLPSPYVPRLAALGHWAAPELTPGRPVAEAALALMHRLHREFEYRTASTQIDTPLADAFARRRGVCQDFAHVLAGALRMHGVPVRYVSGYLLTHPGPANLGSEAAEAEALVGADASHAWVQVWCPGTPGVPGDGWLDLDPTNAVVPGTGHVRVAVGRDFGDVTPLRGVIRGGGPHGLTVAVQTRLL